MFSTNQTENRVYFRARQPNPLFQEWLEHWLEEAKRKDSAKRFALAKALESLTKYPLVLYTGRDCAILDGFGPNICAMLDKQLAIYRDNNPDRLFNEKQVEQSEQSILCEVKSILEEKQRADCDLSMVRLTKTQINDIESVYRKYDIIDQQIPQTTMAPLIDFMPQKTIIKRQTFKVILLVDTQETAGNFKRSLDATTKSLEKQKIPFEVRRLSAGDFVWICRDERNPDVELLLPYIIERKRMDDLSASIKDGRFHEQKFRLMNSRLANKIYLIESHGNNAHTGLPLTSLLQAASNVYVQANFQVKFTDKLNDSMFYLAIMTRLLTKMFEAKDLQLSTRDDIDKLPADYFQDISTKETIELLSFKEFAEASMKAKNFTIRDLFMRQLLQLRTLSVEKAIAITEKYPSPRCLIETYRKCQNQTEAENLLANISYGKFKKSIGPTISQAIHKLYTL